MATLACWMAVSPLNGSTAAQACTTTSGWLSRIWATYSFVQGGVPATVSISKATSTGSIPAALNSAMTSSSVFGTQARPQYFASASTYGPCAVIQGCVLG